MFLPRTHARLLDGVECGIYRLCVVLGALGDLLRLEHNILHNHLGISVARDLDPSLVGVENAIGDEKVVGVALGRLPGLALVGADFQALGAASGVLDGRREPVLGSTAVHVDAQRVFDGALDPLPFDAVHAAAGGVVGQFVPCVGRHVQVVLVAGVGFVGDLV